MRSLEISSILVNNTLLSAISNAIDAKTARSNVFASEYFSAGISAYTKGLSLDHTESKLHVIH